jgi:uncharacterized protein
VVVTGAATGIGRAAAVEFARRGSELFIAARRESLLETAAEECRRFGVRCEIEVADVGSIAGCRGLIKSAESRLGRVDVLVNNAGFAVFDRIEQARAEDLEEMMRVNYLGAAYCTHFALPGMLARGEGAIVNVASISGLMGYAAMGGYCATKFALIGFTEALRDEVKAHGIRVSMICPGTTDTDFFVRAEREKMPGASKLIPALRSERVARAICDAAERGPYRTILPLGAHLYMRLKEMAPRTAHFLMRHVSALLERP